MVGHRNRRKLAQLLHYYLKYDEVDDTDAARKDHDFNNFNENSAMGGTDKKISCSLCKKVQAHLANWLTRG